MATGGNARGAVLMAGAMAAFTCNDAMMKLILAELPLGQAIFLRGVGGLATLLVIARWIGPVRMPRGGRDRMLLAVRSLAEVATVFLYLEALRSMPLPAVVAIMQALPLAITLAGALFLGERVGWRRTVAIGVGFAGMLLIVRPGSAGFGWPALLVLASVGTVTVRELATRALSADVGAMTAASVMALAVTLASAALLPLEGWHPVPAATVLHLAVAVIGIALGYVMSVGAAREGEIAVVAPFRYTGLVWSLILGWFAFGFWPDPLSLFGGALIAAGGLYTFYREMLLAGRLQKPVSGPGAARGAD